MTMEVLIELGKCIGIVFAGIAVIVLVILLFVQYNTKKEDEIAKKNLAEAKEKAKNNGKIIPVFKSDNEYADPYDFIPIDKIAKYKDLELLFIYLGVRFDIEEFINPFNISFSIPEQLIISGNTYTQVEIFNEIKYQYERFLYYGLSEEDRKTPVKYTVYYRKGDLIMTSATHRMTEYLFSKFTTEKKDNVTYERFI